MTDLLGSGGQSRPGVSDERANVRAALRVGAAFGAAGLSFLVVAMAWVGTCTGSTADALACGAAQRSALALGAPAILLTGTGWAIVRGARLRRDQMGRDQMAWWAWLSAASVLLALASLAAVLAVGWS